MKYEEFVRKFKSQSAAIPRDKQLSLAITICKKLFFDYQKFSDENNWGQPDLLLDAINLADKSRSQEVDLANMKLLLPKIDQITPDTEDFGNASYALNACIAVYETLEFMVDNDPTHIYNVGTYFTDTVYAKIQEDADLTMDQVDNHSQMIEAREFLIEFTR
jgi:uncharacterized protein YjaG (DUF416 family)